MGKHTKIYLSIGGNLGDRKTYLKKAIKLLIKAVGHQVQASNIYETEAWGKTDQEPFLNQVLEMESYLSAFELLKTCLKIEAALGRSREERWGSRSIDIDILFYGDEIIEEKHLQIPHPRLHQRNFVLIPLKEIAPDFLHPVLGKKIDLLSKSSKDSLAVVLQA